MPFLPRHTGEVKDLGVEPQIISLYLRSPTLLDSRGMKG